MTFSNTNAVYSTIKFYIQFSVILPFSGSVAWAFLKHWLKCAISWYNSGVILFSHIKWIIVSKKSWVTGFLYNSLHKVFVSLPQTFSSHSRMLIHLFANWFEMECALWQVHYYASISFSWVIKHLNPKVTLYNAKIHYFIHSTFKVSWLLLHFEEKHPII